MKKTLYVLLGLFLGCQFWAKAQDNSKTLDKIVAVVGKNIILQSEIDQQLMQYVNQGAKIEPNSRCILLQQMLTQKLLKQQADIDSVVADDAQVTNELERRMRGMLSRIDNDEDRVEEFLGMSLIQYKEQMRPAVKEMVTAEMMRGKITQKVTITPKEVEDYYKKIHKDSLQRYNTEVEIGNIEMYPKLSREEKQIYRDKIEALRLRVKSGESFTTLAKLYSEDPGSASNGGEYPFIGRTQFAKEYTSWAFKLKKGEMSPVFETDFGYHFVEVLDRKGDQVKTRHILIVPKPTDESMKRLGRRADSLYKKLVDKKIPFSTAASEYSDNNDTKYNGGMMTLLTGEGQASTYIPMDKVDANIFPVVDTLKIGEFSRPYEFTSPQGKKGLRIFYLKNKVGPHIANLGQDYPKIKEEAMADKMTGFVTHWFDEKRDKTYIKIDPAYQGCSELKEWVKTAEKYLKSEK